MTVRTLPTPPVSRYEAAMSALGIRLPLSHDPTGAIIDADGNMVCAESRAGRLLSGVEHNGSPLPAHFTKDAAE